MLSKMMNKLDEVGYVYKLHEKYFYLIIEFTKCKVEIHETLEDRLFVKILDYEGNVLDKRSYKTVSGAYNFFRKNVII